MGFVGLGMAEPLVGQIFDALEQFLDERQRRLFAAAASRALGRGGDSAVSRATGISRPTIIKGRGELGSPEALRPDRVRRLGGGRRPVEEHDPRLLHDFWRAWSNR